MVSVRFKHTSSKQYKYLLDHQNTQTFTALMEPAAFHALNKEKISRYTEQSMPTVPVLQPLQSQNQPVYGVDQFYRLDRSQ